MSNNNASVPPPVPATMPSLVETLLVQSAAPTKPPNYLQVFLTLAVETRLFGDETPAVLAILAHMQAAYNLEPLRVPARSQQP